MGWKFVNASKGIKKLYHYHLEILAFHGIHNYQKGLISIAKVSFQNLLSEITLDF